MRIQLTRFLPGSVLVFLGIWISIVPLASASGWHVLSSLSENIVDVSSEKALILRGSANESFEVLVADLSVEGIGNAEIVYQAAQIRDCAFWDSGTRELHILCVSDEDLVVIPPDHKSVKTMRIDVEARTSTSNFPYTVLNAALEGRPHEGIRHGDGVPRLRRIERVSRIYTADVDNDGSENVMISRSIGSVTDLLNHYLHVFTFDGSELRLQRSIIFAGAGDAGIGVADFDGDGQNELLVPTAGIPQFYRYVSALEDFYLIGSSNELIKNAKEYRLTVARSKTSVQLVYCVLGVTSGSSEHIGEVRKMKMEGLNLATYDFSAFQALPLNEKMKRAQTWLINLQGRESQLIYAPDSRNGFSTVERILAADLDRDGNDELVIVDQSAEAVVLTSKNLNR